MQTHVAILHHDYPSRVRDLVDEKLRHLLKFNERTVSVRALLERQRVEHRVEIVAKVGRGAVLVADAREDGFAAALETALSRMERLLKRHNERGASLRRRRGGRS